jgi:hypothetical protein
MLKSNFSITSRAASENLQMYERRLSAMLAGSSSEVQWRGVEELLPRHRLEHWLQVLDPP